MLRFRLSYSSSPGFSCFRGLYTAGFKSAIRRRSCFIAAAFCKTSSCGAGPALPGFPGRYLVFCFQSAHSLMYIKRPSRRNNATKWSKNFFQKLDGFWARQHHRQKSALGGPVIFACARFISRVCRFSSWPVYFCHFSSPCAPARSWATSCFSILTVIYFFE